MVVIALRAAPVGKRDGLAYGLTKYHTDEIGNSVRENYFWSVPDNQQQAMPIVSCSNPTAVLTAYIITQAQRGKHFPYPSGVFEESQKRELLERAKEDEAITIDERLDNQIIAEYWSRNVRLLVPAQVTQVVEKSRGVLPRYETGYRDVQRGINAQVYGGGKVLQNPMLAQGAHTYVSVVKELAAKYHQEFNAKVLVLGEPLLVGSVMRLLCGEARIDVQTELACCPRVLGGIDFTVEKEGITYRGTDMSEISGKLDL